MIIAIYFMVLIAMTAVNTELTWILWLLLPLYVFANLRYHKLKERVRKLEERENCNDQQT